MKPYRARSTARLIAFVAVLGVALIAIVVRLAQVQLVQGETFASAARANQIQLIPTSAPRGLIVDRNGIVMVRSRPSFVCALIPSEVVHVDETLRQLSRSSCTLSMKPSSGTGSTIIWASTTKTSNRCKPTSPTGPSF